MTNLYSLTNGTSSETIGDFVQIADYVPGMELNERILKARTDAKMTQQELADAVEKTRGAVAQWESGETKPRPKTLEDIAKATRTPLNWLLVGDAATASNRSYAGLNVIGEVAAGTWLEGSVHYEQSSMPVAAHPDYPANGQRLYQVAGTSINRIAANGDYLHAVDIQAAGLHPESGDLVIVRRMRHGLAEYTAKTFVHEDGLFVLRPESNDPQWQEDIKLDGDDDTEIQITDIVIAKWSPIERRRKVSK